MNAISYKFDWPYVTSLVERGDISHPEVLKTIDALCEVVWARYFNFPIFNQADKEDIIQEGRVKAVRQLTGGYYNPQYSLKNFLYTGIRNEMQNFTVKAQKNPLCGAENFDFDVLADNVYYEDSLMIEQELIKGLFDKFPSDYKQFALDVVLGLQDRGFTFSEKLSYQSKLTFRGREIASKLECLAIWEKMNSLKKDI